VKKFFVRPFLFLPLFVASLTLIGCKEQAKKIKFVTISDNPPFEFKQEDALSGFDIEFAQLIANELHKVGTFEVVDPKDVAKTLVDGNADVAIAALTPEVKSQSGLDSSIPYYADDFVVFLLRNNSTDVLQNLENKRIAYEHKYDSALRENLGGTPVSIDDIQGGILGLRSGEFDAFITTGQIAVSLVENSGNLDLVYAKLPGITNQYVVTYKNGSEIATQINDAIRKLRDEGQLDMLKAKWFKTTSNRSELQYKGNNLNNGNAPINGTADKGNSAVDGKADKGAILTTPTAHATSGGEDGAPPKNDQEVDDKTNPTAKNQKSDGSDNGTLKIEDNSLPLESSSDDKAASSTDNTASTNDKAASSNDKAASTNDKTDSGKNRQAQIVTANDNPAQEQSSLAPDPKVNPTVVGDAGKDASSVVANPSTDTNSNGNPDGTP